MPPNLSTLCCDDVLRIHEALCQDFAASGDPIFPAGVKSQALLESAVGRQDVGGYRLRKYGTPTANAATLTYGLCNDHPFHNGNKRTALVSMLAHLDGNHLTLVKTRQEDLFEMILAVANHHMASWIVRMPTRKGVVLMRGKPDAEVDALAGWLDGRTRRVVRGERQVTYRELRTILRRFHYELEHKQGNLADVVRVTQRKRGIIRREPTVERKRVGTIGYHSDGEPVAIKVIKDVRRITELREEDGCDSESFYGGSAQFDVFINQYRTILRRLAHR